MQKGIIASAMMAYALSSLPQGYPPVEVFEAPIEPDPPQTDSGEREPSEAERRTMAAAEAKREMRRQKHVRLMNPKA